MFLPSKRRPIEHKRISTMSALRDLVLSSRCLMCGFPSQQLGSDICLTCRGDWHLPARRVPLPGVEVFAIRPYDRISQRVILEVKEHGRTAMEPLLAEAIALASLPLIASSTGPVTLVPVPSRPAACRRRGADVLWAIARRASVLLNEAGAPVNAARLLRHARSVVDQSGLDAMARAVNLHGAMEVRPQRRHFARDIPFRIDRPMTQRGSIIVVDDLVTTGATIQEAVRALRHCAEVLGGACAASTALSVRDGS